MPVNEANQKNFTATVSTKDKCLSQTGGASEAQESSGINRSAWPT
jgi:hypothetical protein